MRKHPGVEMIGALKQVEAGGTAAEAQRELRAETPLAGRVLLLELDDVRLEVDADRAEFLKNVLAEEAVHGRAEAAREFVHVQYVNRMGDPNTIGEREVRTEAQSVTLHAGALIVLVEIAHLKLRITVNFGANDGVIGASIQQERGAIVVHAGIHEDHGLRGAERNVDDIGFVRECRRCQEKRDESKNAETTGTCESFRHRLRAGATSTFPARRLERFLSH
jgi:hypothetical protein